MWEPAIKAYASPGESEPLSDVWKDESRDPSVLSAVKSVISEESYFQELLSLWAQESDARGATNVELDLRKDHVQFIKTLGGQSINHLYKSNQTHVDAGKMFETTFLDSLLAVLEPFISDNDRFKQRAGAEVVAGLLRGSKHWVETERRRLWDWFITRLPAIYAQVKPDTITFWEGLLLVSGYRVACINESFTMGLSRTNSLIGTRDAINLW